MLVTGRQWWDYVSYSAGLPMAVIRVPEDRELQAIVIQTAVYAEAAIDEMRKTYDAAIASHGWKTTEKQAREIEI
jgi:predicted metal-dependent phosphoesterase TrpH